MTEKMDYDSYSRMQVGEPLRTFKKTILGKVNVKILDPFEGAGKDILLFGDPRRKNCPNCFVELWTDKEVMYFLRSNKIHLESGVLVEHTKPRDTKIAKTVNNLSDEEIEELVVAPWMKLKATVDKMTSIAAVSRVVDAAETAERPEKTMKYLREKLSLMQSGEVADAN
jgi:hypothetical protein